MQLATPIDVKHETLRDETEIITKPSTETSQNRNRPQIFILFWDQNERLLTGTDEDVEP